jgi:flagellar basal-body rod protein FlgG
MITGLYTSASGMLAESSRHDAIANNLANVSTTGFKKDQAVLRAEPVQVLRRLSDQVISINGLATDLAPTIGSRGQGTEVEAILPNFSQGTFMETSSPTDLAIQGQGFFVVETARGRRYTRQGNFSLNARGEMVTQAGDPVLTSTGATIVPGHRKIEIQGDGSILLDGQDGGRLLTVIPDGMDMLMKEGEGLFAPVPGARFQASGATVVQGHLERSNVNAVQEMVEMIEAMRAYESNQRAIMAQDETLNTLISQVGRFG